MFIYVRKWRLFKIIGMNTTENEIMKNLPQKHPGNEETNRLAGKASDTFPIPALIKKEESHTKNGIMITMKQMPVSKLFIHENHINPWKYLFQLS